MAISPIMKIRPYCHPCLFDLARRVVSLSRGNGNLLDQTARMIDELFSGGITPPAIANRLLAFIREETGVDDPYALRKEEEFRAAKGVLEQVKGRFSSSLEGTIQLASLGNAVDFFIDDPYELDAFHFSAPMEKIASLIDSTNPEVLIFGDNVGEFLLDLSLIRLLEARGKTVYYAAKEGPVQNDLSMRDVEKFHLVRLFSGIISTGTDQVGMRREDMRGLIKDLWEGEGLVIAKGMGNYETISEFDHERPVVYIMKVKCKTVSETVGTSMGTYTAIIGGEHGNKERVL